MVEFQNCSATDDQLDAMSLAGAFQAARDDDIRKAMNAMSTQTETEEALRFFIVPSSWFLKAYPILTARSPDGISDNWRDQIGRITNAELMNGIGREVSSDDEPENNSSKQGEGVSEIQRKRFELLHRRMARNRERSIMKQGLIHKKDYFFLGPSAWMLVKEKFGFDGYELARPSVWTESTQNTLAIQLRPDESEGSGSTLIDIPASGRFAYEKVMSQADSTSASAIVPEEEEANNAEEDEKSEDDPPVLLLPPSTTAEAKYSSTDDMDVETNTSLSTPMTSGRKRLASGLGNLGNTCFMNSSLQCLAHTEPLRRYFLSGEYANDLNRDNPLGTGGELATQFASLMGDMWGVSSKRRNVLGAATESHYANSSSAAVYPRSFKFCLGKHAEQFMGYDQHDSQELATYLLDALHEDTNRVTQKPYVEKPEQGEDELDGVAAKKAWSLHLQREDSRVLENFMGQIKSRLECCREDCNRVSTTFDPFMYLSVPIPGATDRTLQVTFVPLDPNERMKTISLTLSKASVMTGLMKKLNEELLKQGAISEPVPLEDLSAADVWSNEIFNWYDKTTDIDTIRDTDNTFIFQLKALAAVQEESKQNDDEISADDVFGQTKRTRKYKLDLDTMTRLNNDDDWQTELEKYVQSPTLLCSIFNVKRGTAEDRMQFHKKFETFIDLCHKEISEEETTGMKRSREDSESRAEAVNTDLLPMTEAVDGLLERSDMSPSFKGVRSRQDVAIMEFCASKFRQLILRMVKDKKSEYKGGTEVQVNMRRSQSSGTVNFKNFVQPLLLRIPSTLTVYGLRELLASRLSRSIKKEERGNSQDGSQSGESSPETDGNKMIGSPSDAGAFGSPELVAMSQVVLAYDRKQVSYGARSSTSSGKKLGMLTRDYDVGADGSPSSAMAVATDEDEKHYVAELVRPKGTIYVDWPEDLCKRSFNAEEFDAEDKIVGENEANSAKKPDGEKTTTVMDCIKKYCQMEQLEETEMWYCNRCKDHVRAWKQFHLYRAPPILIVQLKRFHYSASTHRRDKITSFIDYPLEGLDLTELVSHYEEGEDPIYDCYAVSNHYGGLGGGHYTAYTKTGDGSWCHYDDSRVSNDIPTSEVVSEAAYVLYYRRRDVPVGQDIIEEPQTAALVSDQTEQSRETSDISSNHSARVDDDDDDNMAVDGDGSSRTCPSPIGSMDGEIEQLKAGNVISFANEEEFPPLQ